jgi:hypothetical protein
VTPVWKGYVTEDTVMPTMPSLSDVEHVPFWPSWSVVVENVCTTLLPTTTMRAKKSTEPTTPTPR